MREAFRHHIPISKFKCAFYFLILTLIGIVAPAFFLIEDLRGANLNAYARLALLFSPVSVPLYVFLAFTFASKFFDPKSGLLITDEGLFNNSNIFGGDYVKWSEVSAIHLTTIKSGKRHTHMIEVRTEREDGFSTIKAGWFRRLIMRKDMFSPGCMKIFINKQSLGATYHEIVEALRIHQPTPVIDERQYS